MQTDIFLSLQSAVSEVEQSLICTSNHITS